MSRFDYVKYDEISMNIQSSFKEDMEYLESEINLHLEDGRAKSLVLTKIEEAYMWIGKSIRDSQIKKNTQSSLNETRA